MVRFRGAVDFTSRFAPQKRFQANAISGWGSLTLVPGQRRHRTTSVVPALYTSGYPTLQELVDKSLRINEIILDKFLELATRRRRSQG
jgi:hypothetical protein